MNRNSLWRRVWKDRNAIGDANRMEGLAEFLPAALEIQETPPSPTAKRLSRLLILLFSLALLWLICGKVDVVSTAEGKIIPSSRVKQIQPLQKAVVKKILVAEGERVAEGQALVELDSTITYADQSRIQEELRTAESLLMVSKEFISLLSTVNEEQIVKSPPAPSSFVTNPGSEKLYQDLLSQQWQDYQAQLASYKSLLERNIAEQRGTEAVIAKLEKTVPIIERRSQSMNDLHKKGFASETDYLQLEQEHIQQVQDLAAQRQNLLALRASEQEVHQKIRALTAQTHAAQLNKVSQLQNDVAVLNEELIKARSANARQVLYAPVAGRVQELQIHTTGGIVTEAQLLMKIVPEGQQLEVEVVLPNKDIGFVNEGMKAELKIHTFPFTQYGIIEGEVVSMSDDAILSEKDGLIYTMRLKMARHYMEVNGKSVNLLPGMAVTAEVKTDQRRIIEYFLRPTKKSLDESLRER